MAATTEPSAGRSLLLFFELPNDEPVDFRFAFTLGAVWTLTGDAFGVVDGARLPLFCVALGRRGGVAVEGMYDGADAT